MSDGFHAITTDGSFHMKWSAHYKIYPLETITQVHQIMPNPDDPSVEGYYEYNWLFLSTSGVHGLYTTLDDIEKNWDYIESYKGDPEDQEHHNSVTVLIVHPRTCVLKYGHLEIQKEDIPYLRKYVEKTIEAIIMSQQGNLQSSTPKVIK